MTSLIEQTVDNFGIEKAEGFNLRSTTPFVWTEKILENIPAFLIDHASCERKAMANCMSFVVKYPDRPELIEQMIRMAREELEHFYQVYRVMRKRNLQLGKDEKDPYVNLLLEKVSTSSDERLLDRLMVAGVIEARGCERFDLVSQAMPDPELKRFYKELSEAEARHHSQFLRLAKHEFGEKIVAERIDFWLDYEAKLADTLPYRHALH